MSDAHSRLHVLHSWGHENSIFGLSHLRLHGLRSICSPGVYRRRLGIVSERFLREADRQRFVISHAPCEPFSAPIRDTPPLRVDISRCPAGSNRMARLSNLPSLRFKSFHIPKGWRLLPSRWIAKLGLTWIRVRPSVDIQGIVARYFAGRAGEMAGIARSPAACRLLPLLDPQEVYLRPAASDYPRGSTSSRFPLAPG